MTLDRFMDVLTTCYRVALCATVAPLLVAATAAELYNGFNDHTITSGTTCTYVEGKGWSGANGMWVDQRPNKAGWMAGDYVQYCDECVREYLGNDASTHCARCVYGEPRMKMAWEYL
jgi:hypothetical protein